MTPPSALASGPQDRPAPDRAATPALPDSRRRRWRRPPRSSVTTTARRPPGRAMTVGRRRPVRHDRQSDIGSTTVSPSSCRRRRCRRLPRRCPGVLDTRDARSAGQRVSAPSRAPRVGAVPQPERLHAGEEGNGRVGRLAGHGHGGRGPLRRRRLGSTTSLDHGDPGGRGRHEEQGDRAATAPGSCGGGGGDVSLLAHSSIPDAAGGLLATP